MTTRELVQRKKEVTQRTEYLKNNPLRVVLGKTSGPKMPKKLANGPFFNVLNSKVIIIGGDSSTISNETHGIIYISCRLIKTAAGRLTQVDVCVRKIGYTQIIDSWLLNSKQGDNDVFRKMVAKRISEYKRGTGSQDHWKIDYVLVVQRDILGDNIQIDKDVQSYCWDKIGTEFGHGQDLINLDYKNKLKDEFSEKQLNDSEIGPNSRLISTYLKDYIVGLYDPTPLTIELDCAQAVQVAIIEYDTKKYYKKHGSLMEFKALAFNAPRTGKTFEALWLAQKTFAKKYGFKSIVMFNWVLSANTSYQKVIKSDDSINIVDKKNPVWVEDKLNIAMVSAHGQGYKKHLKDRIGPVLVMSDEGDEGMTCKKQKEKLEWIGGDAFFTCSGSGLEKLLLAHEYDSITSLAFSEPLLFNEGKHPFQTIWYQAMPRHIKTVIDKYRNHTPNWSEARVPWNVGDLILSDESVKNYRKLGGIVGKESIITMAKFLHAQDNAGMRKDFYSRMLFGEKKTNTQSALNCGIELSGYLGHQPWTMLIDIEATNNKEFDTHIQEFNTWALPECRAVGIAVNGDNTDYTAVLKYLSNEGISIEIPKKFSNRTTEDKMNNLCEQLHKLGYKVIFFSKGMGFKSNSCEYIEVCVHMRDGGSIDVRYQAGARPTTPGLRFNGSNYVPKEAGFDIYVSLNAKQTYANLMRQTMLGMDRDLDESVNRQKPFPPKLPNYDPRTFYETMGTFTNESGSIKKLSIEEAYRYANTPEVVQAIAGAQGMMCVSKLDVLSDSTKPLLCDMLVKLGKVSSSNSWITGNKTGGETTPPKPPKPPKTPPTSKDKGEKHFIEQFGAMIRAIVQNLGAVCLVYEDYFDEGIDLETLDIYDILEKLDENEEIFEFFGISGKNLVSVFTELSHSDIGLSVLGNNSLNHLAMRQHEELTL